MCDNNKDAFLALVRAGLWEKEVRLSQFGEIDFSEIYQLADEQSVFGLVAAGLDHVSDIKVPQEDLLQFIGQVLQLEQQNSAMNNFISMIVEKMRKAGIYVVLVKGQGIAQCYERPLWRGCGDVDFLLSADNYHKAKEFLLPLSSTHDEELDEEKHISMTIDSWVVEIHGSLPSRISSRADKTLEKAQRRVFYEGNVSSWANGNTTVFMLHTDEDVVFVFTHILKHYFRGGIGLRQICDWCRLLWAKRDKIDRLLLTTRLEEMRFMSEWKAFAALAVEVLGMPSDAIPLYEPSDKISKKARHILNYIIEVGNFGHNRDCNFRENEPFLKRKWIAFKYKMDDFVWHFRVFPLDSIRVLFIELKSGIVSTLRHEG